MSQASDFLVLSQIRLEDEVSCYRGLVAALHPGGLACPRCGSQRDLHIHRRHRDPVLDYQCGACNRVFNAWTGTALQKTHRRPSQLVWLLRGIVEGRSTGQLAREIGCQRSQLLVLRNRMVKQFSWLITGLCGSPRGEDVSETSPLASPVTSPPE